MTRQPTSAKPLTSPPARLQLSQALRRYFVTGLATLFPMTVTVWLLAKIFQLSDRLLGQYLGFQIPGLGLLITVLIILAVGVLSIHFFGRALFQTLESWFIRLPFVRKIYPAIKQLAEFFFREEGKGQPAFRRVVLVEYPRTGSYSIAFVTNESQTTATGTPQMLLTLLIPTPPSPLTGPIVFVPEQDVIALDLSVEDALKLVLSGGIVAAPLKARASLTS